MANSAPTSDSTLSHVPRRRRLRGLIWSIATVLLVSLAAWRAASWARGRALGDLRNIDIDSETVPLALSIAASL